MYNINISLEIFMYETRMPPFTSNMEFKYWEIN